MSAFTLVFDIAIQLRPSKIANIYILAFFIETPLDKFIFHNDILLSFF